MFKRYVLLVGALCILVPVLSAVFGSWVAGALLLIGALVGVFKNLPVGMFLAAIAIGNMSMDGSWVLWGLTLVTSLGLGVLATIVLYDEQVPGRHGSWPGFKRVLVSLTLPIIGPSLIQFLVETDRPMLSGLIVVAALAWACWKLAPRTIIVPPLRFSPTLPTVCNNPVGQHFDIHF